MLKLIMKNNDINTWEDVLKIYKNESNINWRELFELYTVAENFMEKYWEIMNIGYICYFQRLSESFIEKHFDELDEQQKYYICRHQILSKKFIYKICDKFTDFQIYLICEFQKLSKKTKKSIKQKHYSKTSKFVCLTGDLDD